jgi:hypothetical protein
MRRRWRNQPPRHMGRATQQPRQRRRGSRARWKRSGFRQTTSARARGGATDLSRTCPGHVFPFWTAAGPSRGREHPLALPHDLGRWTPPDNGRQENSLAGGRVFRWRLRTLLPCLHSPTMYHNSTIIGLCPWRPSFPVRPRLFPLPSRALLQPPLSLCPMPALLAPTHDRPKSPVKTFGRLWPFPLWRPTY